MISLIAAVGENLEIGKDNHLIWHLPNDLKFFYKTTINHKVIMGYNTYLSIGHALSNRTNIVMVDDKKKVTAQDVIAYDNIEEMIAKEIKNDEEVFVIGGASMYKYFYPLANRMYLTLVKASDKDADTFFPEYRKDSWHKKILQENIDNNIAYTFTLFEREK